MDSDADEHDFATIEEEEEEEIATPEAVDVPIPMEREDLEVQDDTISEATPTEPTEPSEENIPEQPADDSTTQSSETIASKSETDATTTSLHGLPEDKSSEAINGHTQMEPAPSQEEGELSPGITVSKETEDVAADDEEEESSAEHFDEELISPQIGNEVDADGEPINADTYQPLHVMSGYTNSLASILAEISNAEIDCMGGLKLFPGAFIITPFALWFLRIVSVKLRNSYVSGKESKKGTDLTTPETLKMEIQSNHTNHGGRKQKNRHSKGNSSLIEANKTQESPKIETPITKTTRSSSGSGKEAQSTPTPRGRRMLSNLAPFNNDRIKETRKPRRTQSSSTSPRKKRKVETPKTKTPKTKGSSKKEAQNTPRSRGKRMLTNLAPFNNFGIKESESRTSKRSRGKKDAQALQGRSLRKRLK